MGTKTGGLKRGYANWARTSTSRQRRTGTFSYPWEEHPLWSRHRPSCTFRPSLHATAHRTYELPQSCLRVTATMFRALVVSDRIDEVSRPSMRRGCTWTFRDPGQRGDQRTCTGAFNARYLTHLIVARNPTRSDVCHRKNSSHRINDHAAGTQFGIFECSTLTPSEQGAAATTWNAHVGIAYKSYSKTLLAKEYHVG